MKKTIAAVLVLWTLTSCLPGRQDQTLTVGNRYSLTLPSFLKETFDLNGDASLQYQNLWKEFYVIVIDEPKLEFYEVIDNNGLTESYEKSLEGYFDILYENMESITELRQPEVKETSINGMPAKILTMKGLMEGIDIYYAIAIVEGKDQFFQVMTWTLADRQSEYQERMDQILYSLQEI